MVETKQQHSVWLIPDAAEAVPFTTWITTLAGQYQAPAFVPHLTVAPNLSQPLSEILAQTQQLADQLHEFDVLFHEVGIGETYFQSVFLAAKPTDELWQTRRLAAELYGQPQLASQFFPHLSLLYGTFGDTVKATARDQVARAFAPLTFRAKTLVVYTAESDPNLWKEVGSFVLKVRA